MPADTNKTETKQPEWHKKLVASLQDCDQYDRSESPVKGCVGLVFLLIVFPGFIFWLVGIWTDEFRKPFPPALAILFIVGGLLVARVFVVYPLLRHFVRRSKSSMRNSAVEETLNQPKRRPILYLRSFAMDEELRKIHWFHKYFGNGALFAESKEEQLVGQLYSYGPVIGIGKPDEDFPELGAARFYASDENWQQKIIDVVEAAQLVVWMTGTTDGLEWEIQTLTKTLDHSKLLVVCHPQFPGYSKEERENEWKQFVEKMGKHFPQRFPESLGDTRFFVFDDQWNPCPVTGRKLQPAIRSALQQLEGNDGLEHSKEPLGCLVFSIYMAFPFLGTTICGAIGLAIGAMIDDPAPMIIGAVGGFILGLVVGGFYLMRQIKKWKEA